ncbi:MAG: hypothetical protein LBH19_12025 [Dysgonamonadaceae bacterium]|jgi:uncharacterized membrane-anchored protein YhcB (DUF1043 family)|nr:hypothetical protein [Dysgonamonadaceae bacterium]
MKTKYYVGGLFLGILIGGTIGYLIASDPKKRAMIQRFFDDMEGSIEEKIEQVKEKFSKAAEEELSEEAIGDALD